MLKTVLSCHVQLTFYSLSSHITTLSVAMLLSTLEVNASKPNTKCEKTYGTHTSTWCCMSSYICKCDFPFVISRGALTHLRHLLRAARRLSSQMSAHTHLRHLLRAARRLSSQMSAHTFCPFTTTAHHMIPKRPKVWNSLGKSHHLRAVAHEPQRRLPATASIPRRQRRGTAARLKRTGERVCGVVL